MSKVRLWDFQLGIFGSPIDLQLSLKRERVKLNWVSTFLGKDQGVIGCKIM
jgi:hypothetical protein